MSGKYALIIGNTEYTDLGLAQLSAPGKDADDFAHVLKDPNIGAFDEVNVLLNQPNYVIREAIDDFFNQKKPDDLLVLYFSGHGVRDELGFLYLAVKNTFRTKLRATGIRSDFIREGMDQSRSKRQVLILDCCNSGAFAQGTKGATGVSIGTYTAFESGYGRVILTASDSTQFAWEGDRVIGETENSLFTHYLVEGLKGEADRDGDGRITVDELYNYTYERVKEATPKQTPSKFSTKEQGEIVLRQITRIEDIKPVALPEDLISEIEDIRPLVREGAVQRLEKFLSGRNIGQRISALDALEKIVEDENTTRRVTQLATHVLESYRQVEQKAEAERKANEEAKRLAILKAEEERLAQEKAEAERKAKEETERLARAQAEREAAEREAIRLKAEREAAEKASRKAAEKAAKEKAEKEIAERDAVRLANEHEVKLKEARVAKHQVASKKSTTSHQLWVRYGVIGGIIIGLVLCGFATIKILSTFGATPPPIIITATDELPTKSLPTSMPIPNTSTTPTPTRQPKSTNTAVRPVTITWWHLNTDEAQKAVWQKLADSYMGAHPNVTIQITVLENETFKSKLSTAMLSGEPPDIFQSWGGGVMNDYAKASLLKDITADLDADDSSWRNTFSPGVLGVYSFNGKNYGVPWDMGMVGLWYNKNLFSQAGISSPPTTWTEFLNDVRQLKAAGITPIALGEGDKWPGHFWYAYLSTRTCGQTGFQAAESRSGSFASPCFITAGEKLNELIALRPFQSGFLAATYGDESATMGNGKAAMELMGQWAPSIQASNSASGNGIGNKLGWFPFPYIEGGSGTSTDAFGGGNGFAIGKNVPPEAVGFVKYLTTVYAQINCAQANMCLPVVKGSEKGLSDPNLITIQQYLVQTQYFQLYYDQALPPAVGSVINDSIKQLFAGTFTPQQAAQAIENSAAKEIK